MEVINAVGKLLKEKFPKLPIYGEAIEQNFKIPSFRIKVIDSDFIGAKGIKFNKFYILDIIYHSNSEIKAREVMDIVSDKLRGNIPGYKLLNLDPDFVDNEGHLIVSLMKINYEKVKNFECGGFYGELQKAVERVSGKKCYFITCDLSENNINEGVYIIRPDILDTEVISLNHRKEKERTVNLAYLEDSSRHSMQILTDNEKEMDLLLEDKELKKKYINMDYGSEVNYEAEDEYFTDLIYFDTVLTVKER